MDLSSLWVPFALFSIFLLSWIFLSPPCNIIPREGQLTNPQIASLGSAIAADSMASIAISYMGIDNETMKNIDRDTRNAEAFNREILKQWTYRNPDNQVQVR